MQRWEANSKIDFKNGMEFVMWIGLAENRNQYLAVCKAVMYILLYKMRVS